MPSKWTVRDGNFRKERLRDSSFRGQHQSARNDHQLLQDSPPVPKITHTFSLFAFNANPATRGRRCGPQENPGLPLDGPAARSKKGISTRLLKAPYNALPFHFKPLRTPVGSQGPEFRDVQISPDFTPSIRDNCRVCGRRFFSGRAESIWQGGQESAIRRCHQLTRRLLDGRTPWKDQAIENLAKSPYAKLRQIPVHAVTIKAGFWVQRREVNVSKSIPTMHNLPEANGRMNNFRRLAGKSDAAQSGPVFSDSDVYKRTEAVGFALQSEGVCVRVFRS